MRGNILFLGVCGLVLAACATTDSSGNPTGPLGQPALMTDAVKTAVAGGLQACASAAAAGAPAAGLEGAGFTRTRKGYSAKIDNPNVLGSSTVKVSDKREGCEVWVSPVYPSEAAALGKLAATQPGNPVLRSGTDYGVGFASATYEY